MGARRSRVRLPVATPSPSTPLVSEGWRRGEGSPRVLNTRLFEAVRGCGADAPGRGETEPMDASRAARSPRPAPRPRHRLESVVRRGRAFRLGRGDGPVPPVSAIGPGRGAARPSGSLRTGPRHRSELDGPWTPGGGGGGDPLARAASALSSPRRSGELSTPPAERAAPGWTEVHDHCVVLPTRGAPRAARLRRSRAGVAEGLGSPAAGRGRAGSGRGSAVAGAGAAGEVGRRGRPLWDCRHPPPGPRVQGPPGVTGPLPQGCARRDELSDLTEGGSVRQEGRGLGSLKGKRRKLGRLVDGREGGRLWPRPSGDGRRGEGPARGRATSRGRRPELKG